MHLQIDKFKNMLCSNWLSKFCVVISDITEDKIELEECEAYDPDVQGIGTGVYSVRMKLACNLPQLVPNVWEKKFDLTTWGTHFIMRI